MADHAPLNFGAPLSSWLEKNVTRPLYTLSLAAMVCYVIWVVLQKRGRTTPRTALRESNARENDKSSAVDSKPGPGSDVNTVEASLDPQDSSSQDVQLPQRAATPTPAPQAFHVGTDKQQDKENEGPRTQPRPGPEMVPMERGQAPNGIHQSDISGPREMLPRKRVELNGFPQLDTSQNTARENGVHDDDQDLPRITTLGEGKLPRRRD